MPCSWSMGKAVAMMKDFYGLVDNVAVLKHEDASAWERTALKFLFTPLVHTGGDDDDLYGRRENLIFL